MVDITSIKQPVSEELKRFEQAFFDAFHSDNQQLEEIYQYLLENTGKQIRPVLTLLSSKLCGNVTDASIEAAVSLELMHTASLLHDDVIDEASERRGKPSVCARWGSKTAILSGDYLLASSFMATIVIGDTRIWNILGRVGKMLAEGELLQLDNADGHTVDEDRYFSVINRKTATLFAACTESGALAAQASDEQARQLRIFGENLGLAFQIKDDVFDYSDSRITGKPTGNDMKEGKMTLPLIHALQHSTQQERDDILARFGQVYRDESQIAIIQEFVQKKGGIEYAEKKMETFRNVAIEALSSFEENDVKRALIDALNFATQRNH